MFQEIKARRAARRLVEAFPEVTEERARERARRMLREYPSLTAAHVADYLVYGEHTAQTYERLAAIGRAWA
ncbi:hypothetical protein [Streptomyces sp. NPDC005302]|uniref:hypothetical protein n=1 Tax=Streptomyces sp. NPDC005302 TaxID=3154675 RepID=UPI0033B6C23C